MANDNIIDVGVRVDTGQLKSGMNEAVSVVEKSTAQMQSGYDQLARATIAAAGAQDRLRDAMKLVNQGVVQGDAAVKILATEMKDAAIASEALAEAQKNIATAVEATVPQYAAASAAVRGLDGNLSIRAAERFLTTTLKLGPALQAAFPLFGALALGEVIGTLTERMTKLIADTIIYGKEAQAAFSIQLGANKAIADAEDRIAQDKEEHFKNTHNAVQNAIHDLQLNADAHRPLQEALAKDSAALAEQRKQLLILRQSQDPNNMWAQDLIEKQSLAVAGLSAKVGQEKTQIEALDARALVLGDHLKDAHEKAAEAAEKHLTKAQKLAELYDKNLGKARDSLLKQEEAADRATTKSRTELIDSELKEELKASNEKIKAIEKEIAAKAKQADDTIDAAHKQQEMATETTNWELRENLISNTQAQQQLRAALEKEYEIELFAFQQKLALYAADSKEYERVLSEKQKAEERHQKEILKLDQQAAQQKLAFYQNVFHSIDNTLRSSLAGIIQGNETAGQAFKNLLSNMLISEAEYLAEIGLKRAERWLLDKVVHQATQATEGTTMVMSDAAVGAAAAYASTAAIPIIGPELAPASAALAYADISAFAPLASAAGGWGQVPSDTMALIHKDEMVLPAAIADHVRRTSQAPASSSAATGNIHFAPTVFAMDAKGVDRVLRDHGDKFIKEALRRKRLGQI